VQDGVNNISITLPCSDIQAKVTEAVTKLNTIHDNMKQNEVKTAEKEREEIESLVSYVHLKYREKS